jgi:hypothetical protein
VPNSVTDCSGIIVPFYITTRHTGGSLVWCLPAFNHWNAAVLVIWAMGDIRLTSWGAFWIDALASCGETRNGLPMRDHPEAMQMDGDGHHRWRWPFSAHHGN